jgi:serine/threonine protein kinase
MLTGERAFRGASSIETLRVNLTSDPPKLPSSLSLPPALAAIVTRLLAKSPNARFQSAADVAEALERVVAAVRDAIYYIPCQSGSDVAIYRLNPATGERQQVGRLVAYQAGMPSGFEVSPDERTILYDRVVSAGEDLMVMENFK